MRFIDIKIFHTGQTQLNRNEVTRWLKHIGVSEDFELPEGEELSDPALLIALAAKRCYMSFEVGLNPNVTKIREEWTGYLDNVLSKKHGSVLEHSVHNFAFEGVSRVFTAEMNRHRAGVAISEASMRYIRYKDIPMWLPDSIKLTEEERGELEYLAEREQDTLENLSMAGKTDAVKLLYRKWRTQEVFRRALEEDEKNYAELQEIWAEALAGNAPFSGKKHITSMMRRIIPLGVATGGCWSLNIRALRHIMAMRASPQAEEEMLHVWSRAGKIMVESEPALLCDFSQNDEGYWVPKYEKV